MYASTQTEKSIFAVNPDFIFLHGGASGSVADIVKYLKLHPDRDLVVDCHADYNNSGKNWLSLNILHKKIYRYYYHMLLPYSKMFYGTLPLRCEFLHNVYKIPRNKIDFLPMGVDDTDVQYNDKRKIRLAFRKQYNLDDNDFIIVSGGKIEKRKNIIELIKAVQLLKYNSIKLVLFGEPAKDIQTEFNYLIRTATKVIYIGWLKANEIHNVLFASDLAVFPGTHSVLWEQTVACGVPAIFKKWEGITHVDLEGNCVFIENITTENLAVLIEQLFLCPDRLHDMKLVAEERGRKQFSYYEIAKKTLPNNIN